MGTSSSYGGPKGKKPSLPNDIDGQNSAVTPSNVTINKSDTANWKDAKTQTSKYLGGTVKDYKTPLSSYVRAHGGSSKAASSAISGKNTTLKLGQFLSSTSVNGVKNTLDNYNIPYEGRSIEEVLSDLVNQLAPDAATKEDSVARNAFLDSIEEIYETIEENDGNIEDLDSLSPDIFEDIMTTYVSSYIFHRFLNDLESRFEKYSQSSGEALNKEMEIKEYIQGVVENTLIDKDIKTFDFNSKTVMSQINLIYEDCYEVIEGALEE